MKINFVTNSALSETSGGISGMNYVMYEALREVAEINYVGPVSPPISLSHKAFSKTCRCLGLRGDFFFFSNWRLQEIAKIVSSYIDPTADIDFYHGFTPWIACDFGRPYVAWNDCSFNDYIRIYHKENHFSRKDLERIRNLEKTWLQRANSVFLTSEWAKHRLELAYDIPPSQTRTVGIFGVMDPPDNDVWSHGKDFYFISTDYVRKNGAVCRRAMDYVWKRIPDAKLHIIGDKPPDSDLLDNRVTYEGFFRKSNARELEEFRSHLAKACALLHPTNADVTPLITVEAAFFGCPSISVNDFAIPEVLGRDLRHMCLERPVCSLALAKAICELVADETTYMKLRKSVRTRALTEHTVKAFTRRLHQAMRNLERA